MAPPTVRTVQPSELGKLTDVLMLAFSTDPIGRYGFPGASQYLAGMRFTFDVFGRQAIDHQSAFVVDDFAGAAIWFPPGVSPNSEPLMELGSHLDPARAETFMQTLAAMSEHHPEEPHWYLNFIGTDVTKQGMGYGAALLKHVLAIVDEAGAVAYLESSNPRNMSLYERAGFDAIARIQINDGPVVHPMVRPIHNNK